MIETAHQRKQKVEAIIADIARDIKPQVERIESDPMPTTQNNYGRYMAILSQVADTPNTMRIFATALIRAGANKQGVLSALKIIDPTI